ncbi:MULTISPECIES: thioesterase II family protein [unclassified Streptomyces]|uniref:thioesterase II family protein n=1 Tax=unclassified Streptomyces TaxID=2593676 RepID=UPI000BF0F55B
MGRWPRAAPRGVNGPADALAARPDRWIVRPAVPHNSDRDLLTGPLLRLVCVPYAGGGASVYQRWGRALLPAVEPWALRLPGHDARMAEPLATDLVSVASDAAAALVALGPGPYALFGHSLGAFLAFEIARALRDRWDTDPTFLAVGGRNAPHVGMSGVTMSHLPDDQYLDLLDRRFGAIPQVIREDAQMRALYPRTRLPHRRDSRASGSSWSQRDGLARSRQKSSWAREPRTSVRTTRSDTSAGHWRADSWSVWMTVVVNSPRTTSRPGARLILGGKRTRTSTVAGQPQPAVRAMVTPGPTASTSSAATKNAVPMTTAARASGRHRTSSCPSAPAGAGVGSCIPVTLEGTGKGAAPPYASHPRSRRVLKHA